MSPVHERDIAAWEGEICPRCGQRRVERIVGLVGSDARRFVIGVAGRVACGCPPEPKPLSAPKNPLASEDARA